MVGLVAVQKRRAHPPAPAAAPLDHDRDQVRLLHGPDKFDQLGDGNAVRSIDAEHDQALRRMVGQLRAIVKVELLEGFQDVVETTQALPALLIVQLAALERGRVRHGLSCERLCHLGIPAWGGLD